jgi:hypothetical protein
MGVWYDGEISATLSPGFRNAGSTHDSATGCRRLWAYLGEQDARRMRRGRILQ